MFVRDYYVELRLVPREEGGGWLLTVPDLPGCMSDGPTIDQAAENVADAIDERISTARSMGREIPRPLTVDARRA